MNNANVQNLTTSGRIVRVIAGLALALSVSFQSGPLGLAALLPLIAIYPIMTGIVGWDPLVKAIATMQKHYDNGHKGSVSNAV